MRLDVHPGVVARTFVAVACFLSLCVAPPASGKPADDAALSLAICPIVYQVDQSPSPRGYRYLFYGNGFFINEQGYLITAAHVLSSLHGGQPFVLLRRTVGPPQFVLATLVIVDREHDVALLRATPNPFEGSYKVAFLPLIFDALIRGHGVTAASVLPPRPREAYTLDGLVDYRSPGDVFDFRFSQLDRGQGDTQLFLFNHLVRRGQSGAPIVSAESQGVVGFVEGQWLRSTVVPVETATQEGEPGVGAAVPVHYAIALLQQAGVLWHPDSRPLRLESPARQDSAFSAPAPLSLVASSYPSQAFFGAEVVLDALIDNRGRIAETKVVRGSSPFLEKALGTLRTWSFIPALLGGQTVQARVGITFQFSQSYEPPHAVSAQCCDGPLAGFADRGPVPVFTVEPRNAATSAGDGTVILYDRIDRKGQIASVQVLGDDESLGSAALAAANQWRFAPARRSGMDVDSTAIVVMVFRRIEGSPPTTQKK